MQFLFSTLLVKYPFIFFSILKQSLISQGYQLYFYTAYSDLHHFPQDLFSLMEIWEGNVHYISLSNFCLGECFSLNNANNCNYGSKLIDWAVKVLKFPGVF